MRIRVTALTKRYVAYEYAHSLVDDVYHLPPSDELFQQLFFASNSESAKTLEAEAGKEDITIDIFVKAHYARLIMSDVVGLRLHRWVKKEMCREVELTLASSIDDTIKMREGLKNWLLVRGIEDEEFSLETAVKTFFRFRQEKLKKIQRNVQKSCTPFVLSKCNIVQYRRHLNFEDILRGYIAENEVYFLTTRKKTRKRRVKQARCWIMRKIGLLTPDFISEKTKIPKRTVQHAVRRFDLFLNSKPNLKRPTA